MSERDFHDREPAEHRPHEPGDHPARLSPDDRFEIAAAVDAAARNKRPVSWLLIVGVAVAAAGVALGAALVRRAEAASSRDRAFGEQAFFENTVPVIEDLRARREASGTASSGWLMPPGQPSPRVAIQRLANESGLEDALGLPEEQRASPEPGVRRTTWSYELEANDLADLMGFVRLVSDPTRGPAGLRLAELRLRPQPARQLWQMTVEFERFEREPGA